MIRYVTTINYHPCPMTPETQTETPFYNSNIIDAITGENTTSGSADKIIMAIQALRGNDESLLRKLAAKDDDCDPASLNTPEGRKRERERILQLLRETLYIMPERPTLEFSDEDDEEETGSTSE